MSAEFTIESATKNERATVKLYKGTDLIVQRPIPFPAYPDLEARTTAHISRLVTSLDGDFTFKVTMQREFIASLSVIANSNAPAWLTVEDLGAV